MEDICGNPSIREGVAGASGRTNDEPATWDVAVILPSLAKEDGAPTTVGMLRTADRPSAKMYPVRGTRNTPETADVLLKKRCTPCLSNKAWALKLPIVTVGSRSAGTERGVVDKQSRRLVVDCGISHCSWLALR